MMNTIRELYMSFLLRECKLRVMGGKCYYRQGYDRYWFHINIAQPEFGEFVKRHCGVEDG